MEPVSIIVVNFNSGDEIQRLVSSFSKLSLPWHLTIVDNASPDGSGEVLSINLQDTNIRVLKSERNGGFAYGVNLGVQDRINNGAQLFWILNPDTELANDALVPLVAIAEIPKSIAGSKILYPKESDGMARIWGAGGFVDYDKLEPQMRGTGELDAGQFQSSVQCDYLPGCSICFSKIAYEEIGPFPEEYFLYFEETDWCARAKNLGFKLVYEPKSVVTHNFREEKLSEPLVTYYYNRNRRHFFFRRGGWKAKWKIMSETIFKDLPEARRALREAEDSKKSLFKAHVISSTDFLLNRLGQNKDI